MQAMMPAKFGRGVENLSLQDLGTLRRMLDGSRQSRAGQQLQDGSFVLHLVDESMCVDRQSQCTGICVFFVILLP